MTEEEPLDPARPIAGLRDSKRLSAPRREQLAVLIRARACSFAIAEATINTYFAAVKALAENGGGVMGFDEAACAVTILQRC